VIIGGIALCGLLIFVTKLIGRRYLGWGTAGGAMVTLSIDSDQRR